LKTNALQFLSSPCCGGDLDISLTVNADSDGLHLEDGLLTCIKCGHHYPVIGGIPRLLKDLDKTEEDILRNFQTGNYKTEKDRAYSQLSEEERYRRIDLIVSEKIRKGYSDVWHGDPPVKDRTIKNEIEYRARICENQTKTVKTITKYCQQEFKTILDIAGGTGGLLKCLSDHFKPDDIFMVDHDLDWVEVTKLRCPDAQIIRADAANLPFKENSIDLVVTSSALEHIREYRKAVKSICTVTKDVAYLAWGPNKFAGYDLGHSQAPVAFFPKSIGRYVAYAWHRLLRTGMTRETIDRILGDTFFISTLEGRNMIRHYGTCKNVFVDFVMFSMENEGFFYQAYGIKSKLKKYPRLIRFLASLLVLCKIEPDCYYLLIKDRATDC
jgi:uncharacterized protein YbaR (Trm112 family)